VIQEEFLWFTKGSEGKDFQTSSGRLDSFKSRNLIPHKKTMSGESNGVSQVVVELLQRNVQ
jgi:hypothetical protein